MPGRLILLSLFAFSACAPPEIEGVAQQAAALTAQDFGYDSLRARGTRPLLLVLGSSPGRPFDWTAQQYADFVFGSSINPNPLQTTLLTYFSEISNALFGFSRAGIVQISFSGPEMGRATRAADAKRLAAQVMDFGTYDSNCNGQITTEELAVVLLDTSGGGWASGSDPACVPLPTGTRNTCGQPVTGFCSTVASVGYQTDLMSMAHELLHTLGTLDVYSNGCNANGLTVMSCTGGGHDTRTWHPDPWHKMLLGWVEPRVISMWEGAGPSILAAPQEAAAPYANGNEAPILLYDPNRGATEYYLLEYRNPARGGHDRDVATRGLVAWYVSRFPGAPEDVPLPGDSAQYMRATTSYGAPTAGALGQFNNIQGWQKRHGTRGFTWADGSHPPTRVAVTTDDYTQGWIGLRIFNGPPVGFTLVGDLTGDGRADMLAVNPGDLWSVTAYNSIYGNGFTSPTQRLASPFYGTRGTYLADLNGDRRADAVAINDGEVWVSPSANGAARQLGTGRFWGSRATLVGDVNGDGRADIVAINGSNVQVALGRYSYLSPSSFLSFAPPTTWLSGLIYGNQNRDTLLADVDGDGRADIVTLDGATLWVAFAKSTGDGFEAPAQKTPEPIPGGAVRGVFAADSNADGTSDLFVVNDGEQYVYRGYASRNLTGAIALSTTPFYGSRVTAAADVDNDRRADLIGVNDGETWVYRAPSYSASPPERWLSVPFYGWY
jgi:M6 family metalloprotease-like protein